MTKIVCISDTHNRLGEIDVPAGDTLVHCGDWTSTGKTSEIFKFRTQIKSLPHKTKIVIAGNHDQLAELNPSFVREIFNEIGVIYLQDESVTVDGLKFYGSPYTPEFYNWSFMLPRGKPLADKWELIPDDTDVLLTHGPPLGMLDQNPSGDYCGCEELSLRVQQLHKLKLHVFGHIHQGYGIFDTDETRFVNASICTERYTPTNKPIIVEI